MFRGDQVSDYGYCFGPTPGDETVVIEYRFGDNFGQSHLREQSSRHHWIWISNDRGEVHYVDLVAAQVKPNISEFVIYLFNLTTASCVEPCTLLNCYLTRFCDQFGLFDGVDATAVLPEPDPERHLCNYAHLDTSRVSGSTMAPLVVVQRRANQSATIGDFVFQARAVQGMDVVVAACLQLDRPIHHLMQPRSPIRQLFCPQSYFPTTATTGDAGVALLKDNYRKFCEAVNRVSSSV